MSRKGSESRCFYLNNFEIFAFLLLHVAIMNFLRLYAYVITKFYDYPNTAGARGPIQEE